MIPLAPGPKIRESPSKSTKDASIVRVFVLFFFALFVFFFFLFVCFCFLLLFLFFVFVAYPIRAD